MKIELHIQRALWADMHADIDRPHAFAMERVGFLTTCIQSASATHQLTIAAIAWKPVADNDYLDDRRVGASIGANAFRQVLQHAHSVKAGILHVHRHDHRGTPRFSIVDAKSMSTFIPGFFNAQPSMPHGALVLSLDSAYGVVRLAANSNDLPIHRILLQP